MKKKLLHKYGIEKTFVLPVWDQQTYEVEAKCDIVFEAAAAEISKKVSKKLINRAGTDPGCLEVSSKPFTSYSQAEDFFEKTTEIAFKHGLKHYTEHILGCGGHIHVEKLGSRSLNRAMWNYAKLNPWMNAFGHPEDDINLLTPSMKVVESISRYFRVLERTVNEGCSSYYSKGLLSSIGSNSLIDVSERLDFMVMAMNSAKMPDVSDYYISEMIEILENNFHVRSMRNCTLSPRSYLNTFEFRCFDGVRDWEEQKAHIDYAQAVVKYTEKNEDQLNRDAPCISDLVKMVFLPPREMISGFRKSIIDLGLDWAYYSRYSDNLKLRSKVDKKLLTKMLKQHTMTV